MASDPAGALHAARERRLHPLSWLFVLLASLREFALPLIALLAFGSRGEGWERYQWWGLIGVAVLTGISVVRYFTYRFRIEDGELVIRSGILHRNVRHIPLTRIQNVALKRNLLHRAFDVAEVKLESAVGGSAEAQMRVLSLRDAHALEALVRAKGRATLERADAREEPEQGEVLLTLPTFELVKLGLTSNRGLLLGAAGVGVLSQFGGADALIDVWASLMRSFVGYAQHLHLGVLAWLVAGSAAWALLALAMKLVSVVMMLVQSHGFTLRELEQRLSVERGLFTRHRSNAPLRKIQHWTLRESWLHRKFDRRSLKVETAVLEVGADTRGLSELVPIASPPKISELLQRWLPWLDVHTLPWQPLHESAWRPMAFKPSLFSVLATFVALPLAGPGALVLLSMVPFWRWRARKLAACASWAANDRVLAWRSGWLDHRVSFAEIAKLQGLQLVQTPFDRRRGMAAVVADTAGASPLGHRLELKYLPEDTARELYERVATQIAASRLRW